MHIVKKGSHFSEEMYQLMILKTINENSHFKQRNISEKTGINLMKVNNCVRYLIKAGYIEIKNKYNRSKKLSYIYHLTPEGLKYKSILTYKFIEYIVELHSVLDDTFSYNLNLMIENNYKKIILCGNKKTIEILEPLTKNYDFDIVQIINEEDLRNYEKLGRNKSTIRIENQDYDTVVVLCFQNHEVISSILLNNGVPLKKLWLIQ